MDEIFVPVGISMSAPDSAMPASMNMPSDKPAAAPVSAPSHATVEIPIDLSVTAEPVVAYMREAMDARMKAEDKSSDRLSGPHYGALPALPEDAAVTMAYVPLQHDTRQYEAEEALMRGTLFKSLDKPFLMAGGIQV